MTDFTGGEWRSLVDGQVINGIPDSVVSRTSDNSSNPTTEKFGVRINSDVEWPSIGATISSNTATASRAQIYRVSDGVLMGETDISNIQAGESFTVDDVNLQPNTDYNFVIDNNGSSWTNGFADSESFPATSDDGQLSIVNGAKNATDAPLTGVGALVTVGSVGFS